MIIFLRLYSKKGYINKKYNIFLLEIVLYEKLIGKIRERG